MKQDIETYLVDSFKDYAGKEHTLVACALSQSPENELDSTLKVGWVNNADRLHTDAYLCHDVYRMVTIGIAICNPEDAFDLERGKHIAYNKAANIEHLPRIYTPNKGVITKEIVDVFLKQQVQFVKENPEKLIKGYLEAKKAYEETQKAKVAIENLSEDEKVAFNLAVKGFDLSKYMNLAKIYVKKLLK